MPTPDPHAEPAGHRRCRVVKGQDRRGRRRYRARCEQCPQRWPWREAYWEASLDARAHRQGWQSNAR